VCFFFLPPDMRLNEATLVGVVVQGIEPGSLVLTAVAALHTAIAVHVKAASANDASVLEASRRADAAYRNMKSLAGATFPDGHPSLAQVVRVLNELEERARKWCESPKWSRRLALSRSGTSKACKRREGFQQLFALLDRALQELIYAVQVESFSNLSELRADFQKETEKRNQEFDAAAAAAGEHAVSQAEALKALGDKEGASLNDLLAASRAQADALAEMESRLGSVLEGLKADLAAGREAAQAAAKAAAAVAEAMQEHGSGGGRGAAEDNTDEVVAALIADILAAETQPKSVPQYDVFLSHRQVAPAYVTTWCIFFLLNTSSFYLNSFEAHFVMISNRQTRRTSACGYTTA
jgi:ElaB/YqjD/DUF883 family membrane-anchored ribosome-binding protein